MPCLPARFAAIIPAFAPLFRYRSRRHAEVLRIGALLAGAFCQGQRIAWDQPDAGGLDPVGGAGRGLAVPDGARALAAPGAGARAAHKKLTDWGRRMVWQARRRRPDRRLVSQAASHLCRYARRRVPPVPAGAGFLHSPRRSGRAERPTGALRSQCLCALSCRMAPGGLAKVEIRCQILFSTHKTAISYHENPRATEIALVPRSRSVSRKTA
jgi:hypothetical protein